MTQTEGKPPAHFVVIVPGYMGSRLRKKSTGELVWLDLKALLLRDPFRLDRVITELFDTLAYPNDDIEPAGIMDQIVFAPPLFKQEHYNRLVNALVAKGYHLDPPDPRPDTPAVYTFAYDWRQDNRISARELGKAIDGWRAKHPGAQAWIIAHSNGGLVARWYIEKEGGAPHVGRLFLMGSPWDGAPKAVSVLASGLEIAFLRIFNRFDVGRVSRDAIHTFPSFYQLVPFQNPFLNDLNNEKVDLFADLRWLEDERSAGLLLDGRKFNQELGNTLSVETLCFFGSRKPTTTFGRVRFAAGGRWEGIEWNVTESGDGTVPERSAVHPNAAQKLPFVAGHGDIYVIPAVLEKLDWEMDRKYRLGVLAEAEVGNFHVQFEPEQDAYLSGEEIGVWATVHEKGANGQRTPVFGLPVQVALELDEALPGGPAALDGPPPAAELADSAVEPGRYEGSLTAPDAPGYYRLVCSIQLPGREAPVVMEELVLVESEQMLSGGMPLETSAPPDDIFDGGPDQPADPGPADAPGTSDGRGRDEEDERASPGGEPDAPSLPDFANTGSGGGSAGGISFGGLDVEDEEDAEAAPPAGGEPSGAGPPEAEPQDEARFLTAAVLDHPPEQPLPPGEAFTLALWIDPARAAGSAQVTFDGSRVFTQDEELVALSVVVTSPDFNVLTREPQSLRVPKRGRSKNTARFDLEPLRPGPGQVTALVFKDNNFVQGMQITLNVDGAQEAAAAMGAAALSSAAAEAAAPAAESAGAAPPAVTAAEPLGRPLDGAFVIQPRDLSIIIKRRDAGGYSITLVGPTVAEAVLPISDNQLAALVDDTRRRMLEVVYLWEDAAGSVHVLPPGSKVPPSIRLAYQSDLTISERVAQEGLLRMAQAGHLLFEQVFYSNAAGPDSIAMGDRLRALLLGGQFKLQIVSQDFLMPWGALYLSDGDSFDPRTLSADRFVGFRHIVEHIPLQNDATVTDPTIRSQPALDLSVNVDEGIDAQFGVQAVAGQLAYFRALAQTAPVKLVERRTAQEFLDAWGDRDNADKILYFYGHAVSKGAGEAGGPAGSSLQFGGGSSVTLADLKLRASTRSKLRGMPLVFINACESAELSPLFYDGFMPYFVARGARGLIGTECQVPVRFADAWARQFFQEFLRGERSLGQIFLQLRHRFLTEHRNILGLLYALYCDGDTRVTPGVG